MKMTKKAIALSLGLVMMGSASFAQSLDDAKKAIDAEQYQKATLILKNLIRSKASAGENYFNLGEVYLRTDYIDSAKMIFTKGIAADPKGPLNYIGMGEIDLRSNNPASAKTNFDKAIDVASKRDYLPYMYIGKAYISIEKPDFAAALPYLKKADELDDKDKDPATFVALGDYYALQLKNSDALGAYMRALSIDQHILRAQVQIGRMYKQARAFPEAEAALKEAIADDPNYGPAYRELAELDRQWADFEPANADAKNAEAITNYKKYLDLTDKSYDSRIRYAQILFYAHDFKTLEQETSELIKMNPSSPKSFVVSRLRGYSAYENQNYPESLQYMKDFFAKAKDTTRIIADDYLYLGKAELKANEDSLALKNILKAARMDSTKVDALADMARSYYDAGNYGKAASTYELVNSINPNGKGSLYNFYFYGLASYFYYGEGYKAKTNPSKDILVKADSAFAHVIKLAPATIDVYLWRGRVNTLLDSDTDPKGLKVPFYQQYLDSAEVLPADKKAAAAKKMIEAYNNIASFAATNGDKVKAKLYWDKCLAIDPQNATALEGLKYLAKVGTK